MTICENCGKSFYYDKYGKERTHQFCSIKCQKELLEMRRKDNAN